MAQLTMKVHVHVDPSADEVMRRGLARLKRLSRAKRKAERARILRRVLALVNVTIGEPR